MLDKEIIRRLRSNKKIQRHLGELQKIVDNSDDGLESITISSGDNKIEFKKSQKEDK